MRGYVMSIRFILSLFLVVGLSSSVQAMDTLSPEVRGLVETANNTQQIGKRLAKLQIAFNKDQDIYQEDYADFTQRIEQIRSINALSSESQRTSKRRRDSMRVYYDHKRTIVHEMIDALTREYLNCKRPSDAENLPEFTPAHNAFTSKQIIEKRNFIKNALDNDSEDLLKSDCIKFTERFDAIASDNMSEQEEIEALDQLIAELAFCPNSNDFSDEEEEEEDSSDDDSESDDDSGSVNDREADVSLNVSDDKIMQSIILRASDNRSLEEKINDLENAQSTEPFNNLNTVISIADALIIGEQAEEECNDVEDLWHKPSTFEDVLVTHEDEEALNDVEDLWHKPSTFKDAVVAHEDEEEIVIEDEVSIEDTQSPKPFNNLDTVVSMEDALADIKRIDEQEAAARLQDPYVISCLEHARTLSRRLSTSSMHKETALLEALCLTNMLTIGQKRFVYQQARKAIKSAGLSYSRRCRVLNKTIGELLTYVKSGKICDLKEVCVQSNAKLVNKHLNDAETACLNGASELMKCSVLKAILRLNNITEQKRADLLKDLNLRVKQYPQGSCYAICDEIRSFVAELRDVYQASSNSPSSLSQEDIDNRDLNVVGRTIKTVKNAVASVWSGLTSWWK